MTMEIFAREIWKRMEVGFYQNIFGKGKCFLIFEKMR